MLWEQSVDPSGALGERFGFDSVAAAETWVSTVLARTWGITAGGCTRIVISDHNAIVWVDSNLGPLVVKWSRARERFASLASSSEVLRGLGERGLPVAAPIATVDGLDRVVLGTPTGPLSVTVLPELTGDWLDIDDESAVRSAGTHLAELHDALRSVHVIDTAPRLQPLHRRVENWLADGDRGFAPDASRRIGELLPSLPALDDEPQLLHNDFRAANILTENSTVVGILDFDEVLIGHRVHDLAKASVYLGTRFTDWRPTPPEVQRTFRAGYESVRPLGPTEARWLELLVLWQAVIAVPNADDTAGWASTALDLGAGGT